MSKAPLAVRPCGDIAYQMGLGRLELPTSRLSDMSRALVGGRERWNQGDLADSALVGDDTGCVTAAAQRRPHKSIGAAVPAPVNYVGSVMRGCSSDVFGSTIAAAASIPAMMTSATIDPVANGAS